MIDARNGSALRKLIERLGVDSTLVSEATVLSPINVDEASQAGIEPATYCLEGSRSVQLSYWDPKECIMPINILWDHSLDCQCIPIFLPYLALYSPRCLFINHNLE